MEQNSQHRYAYFITPHGYGHAARAAAVMEAIRAQQPDACFEIFTHVPIWFFNTSNSGGFHYHDLGTDIGLVQTTAMDEDLPETVRRLNELLPFRPAFVQDLARQVLDLGCAKVLCDIAPLGIAVARQASLPSFLIENFTWDWIYEGYLAAEPRLAGPIELLREAFAKADYHLRTEPACSYETPADLTTNVVSRKPRVPTAVTRQKLGVDEDIPMVMITMGGILTQYPFLERLTHAEGMRFLIPGGSDHYENRGSLVLIPHHSDFYHPDLVLASNLVVGKLGYSTLAEAYGTGVPFVFVPRTRFRESIPMSAFARQVMNAVELSEDRFFTGEWLDLLPDLLTRSHQQSSQRNGADEIADFVLARRS